MENKNQIFIFDSSQTFILQLRYGKYATWFQNKSCFTFIHLQTRKNEWAKSFRYCTRKILLTKDQMPPLKSHWIITKIQTCKTYMSKCIIFLVFENGHILLILTFLWLFSTIDINSNLHKYQLKTFQKFKAPEIFMKFCISTWHILHQNCQVEIQKGYLKIFEHLWTSNKWLSFSFTHFKGK